MSDRPVTETVQHEAVVLISVHRRALDDESTRQLVDDIQTAAAERPAVPIVVDMSAVRFAPSVALGSLVQLRRSFEFDQRPIVLIGVDRRVRQSMKITRLDKILQIRDTLQQVLDDL